MLFGETATVLNLWLPNRASTGAGPVGSRDSCQTGLPPVQRRWEATRCGQASGFECATRSKRADG